MNLIDFYFNVCELNGQVCRFISEKMHSLKKIIKQINGKN